MKCTYCNLPAGFMKSYHQECYEQVVPIVKEIETIINLFNSEKISAQIVKDKLIKAANKDMLYKNHMKNSTNNNIDIRSSELIIHCENMMTASESKNRFKMIRTGYRYEKKPVWNVTNFKLGDNVVIVFTDQSIYLLFFETSMRYPYNKIVNFGYDERGGFAYFDVKTTSPHPHRFYISSMSRRESFKSKNVYSFINCFKPLK